MKYQKINSFTFNLSLVTFILFMIFSFFAKEEVVPILKEKELINYSNNWELKYSNINERVNLPIDYRNFQVKKLSFEKVLPQIDFANNYLFFRSFQSNIDIFVENERVYHYKPENNFFKRIPGSTWVLLELKESYSGKTIRIEKECKYTKYYGSFSEVFLGTKSQIISYLLKASIGGIITSFLMFVLGVISIIISFLMKGLVIKNRKILYLGIFSIACSFWSLGELRIIQLFFGNITFVSHLAFLSVSIGISSFLMFISTFDFYAKDIFLKRLVLLSVLNFFTIILLHISEIKDLFQTLFMTHICIVISVFYISGKFLYCFFKKNVDIDVINLHINMLLFFLIGLTDLVKFYSLGVVRIGGGIRLGLGYFIAIMTIISIKQISKAFSQNLEVHILRKMAFTDNLTKLNNRTALEEKVREISQGSSKERYLLIAVDMNNLKSINDNHGHQVGDMALVAVGKLLNEKFKKFGSVYRLGGDEFLIIADESINNRVGSIFESLNEEIKKDFSYTKIKPYLAHGHVIYRASNNFDETLKIADELMYLCKEKMKNREKLIRIFN